MMTFLVAVAFLCAPGTDAPLGANAEFVREFAWVRSPEAYRLEWTTEWVTPQGETPMPTGWRRTEDGLIIRPARRSASAVTRELIAAANATP
jgi:hypothetical protein